MALTPEADAYVSLENRRTNYGTRDNLRVDRSPLYRTYIRFDLSGVDFSTIRKAELRVYVIEKSDTGFSVRAVERNDWDERRLVYSNRPSVGDFIARSPRPDAGKWITVDITSYVKGDRDDDDSERISVALYGGSNNGVIIGSRESGARSPQLVITK